MNPSGFIHFARAVNRYEPQWVASKAYINPFGVHSFCTRPTAFHSSILEKVRDEQRHHTTLLNAILNRDGNNGTNEQEDGVPEGINFPIDSKEEMKSFQEKLKENNTDKLVVSLIFFLFVLFFSNMIVVCKPCRHLSSTCNCILDHFNILYNLNINCW